MIEVKTITVSLNINPKYLHKNLLMEHIEYLLNKNVKNNCFPEIGKVVDIGVIKNVGIGKIHIDTGYSKTPVTFEVYVCMPKTDDVLKGVIERYDSNGSVYVNCDNHISVFCLNSNIHFLLNKLSSDNNKKEKESQSRRKRERDNVHDFGSSDNPRTYNLANINQTTKNDNTNLDTLHEQKTIGMNVTVKITKVNINDNTMVVLGKIIN